MSLSTVKSSGLVIAASIAGASVLLLTTQPSSAADVTTLTISNFELDWDSPQSAEHLYQRLQSAAHSACKAGTSTSASIHTGSAALEKCEQKAIRGAVEISNVPLLTMVYNRHFPRQALPSGISVQRN